MRYYYQTFSDVGAEQWPTPNHTNFISKGTEIESPSTPLKILSQLKYEFLIFTTKIYSTHSCVTQETNRLELVKKHITFDYINP